MSVWTLSRVPAGRSLVEQTPDSPLAKFVGKVLKWVPADVAVLYTAFIKALVDDPKDDPNIWLTIIFVVLTPIFVVLLAASSPNGARGRLLLTRAMLSIPAFAIWSIAVPNSGWDQIKWFADHPAWVVGFAGVGGLLFSLGADLIEGSVTGGD